MLHVPADLDKERRPENDASVHDQVKLDPNTCAHTVNIFLPLVLTANLFNIIISELKKNIMQFVELQNK